MAGESIFRFLFVVVVLGLAVMRGYYARKAHESGGKVAPTREAVEREGWWSLALRAVLFFVLLAAVVLYAIGWPGLDVLAVPLPPVVRWLAAALALASVGLLTWVQRTLGRQWSANLQIQEGHRLITTGPYRWVRHPLYTAGFGFVAGIALLAANWLFIALSAVSIAGILVRIPKEEAMLLEQFGDEYRVYMQHTGRLLPRLG